MRCGACGYEYEVEYENKQGMRYQGIRVVKGDKEFTKVDGAFAVECDSNEGGTHLEKVTLKACPKCNTVQLERW